MEVGSKLTVEITLQGEIQLQRKGDTKSLQQAVAAAMQQDQETRAIVLIGALRWYMDNHHNLSPNHSAHKLFSDSVKSQSAKYLEDLRIFAGVQDPAKLAEGERV